MVCLLRYAQVIEHSRHCWVNTSALVSGCTNAVGLVMVGNFQVNVFSIKHADTQGVHLIQILLMHANNDLTLRFCLTGWSCQVCTLCWCRCGFSSRAAVCVPAVCAHLPGGCDCTWLLDGPFPSGSGTGSYGVTCPQYPSCSSHRSVYLVSTWPWIADNNEWVPDK